MKKKQVVIMIGIVLSGSSLLVSLWQGYEFYYKHYCYEITDGKILNIERERIETAGGEIGSTKITFHPKITYEYVVNGSEFHSSFFNVSRQGISDKEAVNKLMNSYKVGETATVFYDSRNPENSVLVRDFDWSVFYTLALILGCSLFLSIYLPFSLKT